MKYKLNNRYEIFEKARELDQYSLGGLSQNEWVFEDADIMQELACADNLIKQLEIKFYKIEAYKQMIRDNVIKQS